jgi:hypothetical protein
MALLWALLWGAALAAQFYDVDDDLFSRPAYDLLPKGTKELLIPQSIVNRLLSTTHQTADPLHFQQAITGSLQPDQPPDLELAALLGQSRPGRWLMMLDSAQKQHICFLPNKPPPVNETDNKEVKEKVKVKASLKDSLAVLDAMKSNCFETQNGLLLTAYYIKISLSLNIYFILVLYINYLDISSYCYFTLS